MYLACDCLWHSNERVLFIINLLFRSCLLIMLILVLFSSNLGAYLNSGNSEIVHSKLQLCWLFILQSVRSHYVLKLPNDKCPEINYKQYSLHSTDFVTCNCTSYRLFRLNQILQRNWINTYVVKKAVNTSMYYYYYYHHHLVYAGYFYLYIWDKLCP